MLTSTSKLASTKDAEERNGDGRVKSSQRVSFLKPVCGYALLLLLLLLCNVNSSNGQHQQGATTVINNKNSFLCSEVQVLEDEDLTVQQPKCEFLAGSLSSANFTSYLSARNDAVQYKFAASVSADPDNRSATAIEKCVSSTRTQGTHEYWVLNLEQRQVHLQDFVKAKCSRLSQVSAQCANKTKAGPFQLTETYELTLLNGNCPMLIRIIHEHTKAGCELESAKSLCTAERKTASESEEQGWFLPSCVKNAKYQVRVDVLYRHPVSLEPTRFSAPYSGVAMAVDSELDLYENHSAVCDLLTMETLQLLPHLADHDLRLLVLLRFQVHDESQKWTHTTRIQAMRLLRDQHELHLQSCNATDEPLPLTFHYQNVTNYAIQSGYLDVDDPSNSDYYSLKFWKDAWKLSPDAIINNYFSIDSAKVTVGAQLNSWKRAACQTLLQQLQTKRLKSGTEHPRPYTYRVEELALVLQFNVTTALSRNVSRHWAVSVMFAYLLDVHPYALEQVKCAPGPGKSRPETAQLRVPISESYYSNYSDATHIWQFCADPLCPQFTVQSNGEKHTTAAKDEWEQWSSEQPVEVIKSSVKRANGPQSQFFILVEISTSRVCNHSWLAALDLDMYRNVTHASYRITQQLRRVDDEVFVISSAGFWTEKRVVRAFASDDILFEASCNSTETLTYWQDALSSSLNVTDFAIDKFELSYAPYYAWYSSEYFGYFKEVGSLENENLINYFKPGNSKDLDTTTQQLCKRLEHLPVRALGLGFVPSNKAVANLSLEYKATARVCTEAGNSSSCSNETARIRLRLVQKTLRPWVFFTLNCTNQSSRSQKLEFSLSQVYSYNPQYESIKFGKLEYLSCPNFAFDGVETLDTHGFETLFMANKCERLMLNATPFDRWQQNPKTIRRGFKLVVTNVLQTCRTLVEAHENCNSNSSALQKGCKVFVKVPFGDQSEFEESNRAMLIMLDYKQASNELAYNQPLPKTLQDTDEEPREEVQLWGAKEESEDTGTFLWFAYTKYIFPLSVLFFFLLLVLLHYVYSAFQWKKDVKRRFLESSKHLITPEKANALLTTLIPDASESEDVLLDRVLGDIDSNIDVDQRYKSSELDTKKLRNQKNRLFRNAYKNNYTLPNLRNLPCPLEHYKRSLPKPLDEKELYKFEQAMNVRCTTDGSKAHSLKPFDVARDNSQVQKKEWQGYFTLDFADTVFARGGWFIASKQACSSFHFSHLPEEEKF